MRRSTPFTASAVVGLCAVAALALGGPAQAVKAPKPPRTTVPAVCFAVPSSTGHSVVTVGYCPPGAKPIRLP